MGLSIWKIAIVIAIIVVAVIVGFFTILKTVQLIPIEDSARTKWATYEHYIITNDTELYNFTLSIVGEGPISDLDIMKIQDWLSNNIRIIPGEGLAPPLQVLKDKSGNSLSVAILEYSMLMNFDSSLKSYLILIDISYFGDIDPRQSYATLTVYNNKVIVSDITLPKELLSFVCRLEWSAQCLKQIINNVPYVYDYTVTHVLSKDVQKGFSKTEDFIKWLPS